MHKGDGATIIQVTMLFDIRVNRGKRFTTGYWRSGVTEVIAQSFGPFYVGRGRCHGVLVFVGGGCVILL